MTWLYVFIFLFGLTIGPRCLLSYVLSSEITPRDVQHVYTSLAMFIDSACMISLGVYFYYIKSMHSLVVTMTVLNVALIALIAYGVPESPKYLYEKKRIQEFSQALKWIAKVNRIDINVEEIVSIGHNSIELPNLSPKQKVAEDFKEEGYEEFDSRGGSAVSKG